MEWCADWYAADYGGAVDPQGPAKGGERVLRGGSFVNSVSILRSAARMHYRPEFRLSYLGFRVARNSD
jgi:formylglycine-generating enzyme required for sulfatase activity